MKRFLMLGLVSIYMSYLLSPTAVVSAATPVTTAVTQTKEDTVVTKTVKTQEQLIAALKDKKIDKIVIKAKTNTKLSIPEGKYAKELVVYQENLRLQNGGSFQSTNVIVTSQYQFDKAIKVRNVDSISIKVVKDVKLTLDQGSAKTALIVDSPNGDIINSSKWKSITINNMENSTWTESSVNNTITVNGSTESLVVSEKASVKELVIVKLSSKDNSINILADGKIKEVDVKVQSSISLSGKNTEVFMTNLNNNTAGSVNVVIADKTVSVKPEVVVTPKPTASVTPVIEATTTPVVSQPTVPTTPEVPVVPTTPEVPVVPTVPEVPTVPTVPTVPAVPEVPTVPATPTVPTVPATPTVPTETPHTHSYTSEITIPATCTGSGLRVFTCSEDGTSYSEEVPQLNHNYKYASGASSDCTVGGYITRTCTECGNSITEELSPLGHLLLGWNTIKYPTDTEEGLRTRTCTRCDQVIEQEVIPVGEHVHSLNCISSIQPTCITEGVENHHCNVCGEDFTLPIPKDDHRTATWTVTTPATATTVGEEKFICDYCGFVIDYREIPVSEHTHDYAYEMTTEASCTTNGVITYTCNICGDIYEETALAYGHSFVGSVSVAPQTISGAAVVTGTVTYECIFHDIEPYTENLPEAVSGFRWVPMHSITLEGVETYYAIDGYDNFNKAFEVFVALNDLRSSLGLSELGWDTTMDDFVQLRAAEVTEKQSHERPNLERGYEMDPSIHSENLGFGMDTAVEVMTAWRNSPAHNAAMLNPDYDSVAIGCFTAYDQQTGTHYTGWVQFFHDNEFGLTIQ